MVVTTVVKYLFIDLLSHIRQNTTNYKVSLTMPMAKLLSQENIVGAAYTLDVTHVFLEIVSLEGCLSFCMYLM